MHSEALDKTYHMVIHPLTLHTHTHTPTPTQRTWVDEAWSGGGEVLMTTHSCSTAGQLVGISSMELKDALRVCSLGAFQNLKGRWRSVL